MKVILSIVAVIGGIFALLFALNSFKLFQTTYWGVKHENAQRQVFEQTASFKHGVKTRLRELRREYEATESQTHKDAIRGVVNSELQGVNESELPSDLQDFINTIN